MSGLKSSSTLLISMIARPVVFAIIEGLSPSIKKLIFLLILNLSFFFITLIVSFYLNGYINKVFVGNKLTDPVNERSSHKYPATRSGGISIFFTVCLACAFGISTGQLSIPLYALLSVFFLTFTGFADDLINIRYREKLFLQLFAAVLMFQTGYSIDSFHGVFNIYELPWWLEFVSSVFVFVVVVNALNLIDGLDGLASFVSIKFFLVVGGIILVSKPEWFLFFIIIISALLGFLWFNFNRTRKVFLGDCGSLFIGSIMAFLIFYLLDSESALVTDNLISRPLLTVLLLLYPLIDTLRAFLIRAYNNKSPFVADRVHLHHRLADKGYQHWQASVLTFSLSTFILVVNVLLFSTIGLLGGVALTVVLLTVFYYTFFK